MPIELTPGLTITPGIRFGDGEPAPPAVPAIITTELGVFLTTESDLILTTE
jgi:hypothetical protein